MHCPENEKSTEKQLSNVWLPLPKIRVVPFLELLSRYPKIICDVE